MTAAPLQPEQHDQPSLAGFTPEVLTVSMLLSMPALWTALVERELPVDVLLERFLIVLLTCALLAELVRRLGEGGALGPTPAGAASRASRRGHDVASPGHGAAPGEELGGFGGFSGFDEPVQASPYDAGALDVDSWDASPSGGDATLALDASVDVADLGADLPGFGDLDDLGELAPLDLDADPFADPV
jgi:hypothetical protein